MNQDLDLKALEKKAWTSLGIVVFLALVFGLISYFLDFTRLFIYGLMFAINEILWGRFREPTGPYVVLIFGSGVLVIGLVMLIRFMCKYPLPTEVEVANGT